MESRDVCVEKWDPRKSKNELPRDNLTKKRMNRESLPMFRQVRMVMNKNRGPHSMTMTAPWKYILVSGISFIAWASSEMQKSKL